MSDTNLTALETLYEEERKTRDLGTGLSDKGMPWHSYIRYYGLKFDKLVYNGLPVSLLEIGVHKGSSLHLWKKYFKNLRLVGVDIGDFLTKEFKEEFTKDNVELHLNVDSKDRNAANRLFGDNTFNIIIDDGSHKWEDQLSTFVNYWPKLQTEGYYFIEDVENQESLIMLKQNLLASIAQGIDIYQGSHRRIDDILITIRKT